jgi:acetyltransferase
MSIRNLDAIFRPRSVALIGASNRAGSLGAVIAQNLIQGGLAGPIIPVNPKYATVFGLTCCPDIDSMPLTPDLAVLCTPPRTVPELISRLGARGTKGIIVISAGFAELGTETGRSLQQEILNAARPHLIRIVGPNCLGVIATKAGLNATFAPGNAAEGSTAFVTQSGAIVTSVLDWANSRGIGFSHLVSFGNMADADFGDMLDYLANDPSTKAVLLYIEAVTQPRKFLSAARAAARLKPVIAIKAGRYEASARAAASHTGALAGMDAVYDAAFRRAGILRAHDLEDVFDAVETLAAAPSIAGDELTILTNGGGVGVLAVDSLIEQKGRLTQLTPQTIARLDAVLPPTWSKANPVDIIGDAPPSRYADALSILLAAPETNAVLVLNCPTALASGSDAAEAVIATAASHKRPVLVNWLGGENAATARRRFAAARLPSYDTPGQAVRGFLHLVRYKRAQDSLLEVAPSTSAEFSPDRAAARSVVAKALAAGSTWLAPDKVHALLSAYAIPLARSALAASAEEAVRLAPDFGGPVAIKLVSPDVIHKSDVGGVALDLSTDTAIRAAIAQMKKRLAEAKPQARLEGFLVQEMVRRPKAYELIAGMSVDRQFGPFLLFGQGGTAAEIIADRAIALPPLNAALARALIEETRVYRQLRGFRDQNAVDLDALVLTLVKLSQLICDFDEITEIDLNPLLADEDGVIVLDARIAVRAVDENSRGSRLSIRPYPQELESRHNFPSLGEFWLRPVRPDDASAIASLVAELTPEDARSRFFVPLRGLDMRTLARLTQIDYDREMALVLEQRQLAAPRIVAVARLAADPDNVCAEFAIVVRSDMHGKGIGSFLLGRLIDYARRRGIAELTGEVLSDNAAMLGLCRKLRFESSVVAPGTLKVVLHLAAAS